jgi:hypothetical protein
MARGVYWSGADDWYRRRESLVVEIVSYGREYQFYTLMAQQPE